MNRIRIRIGSTFTGIMGLDLAVLSVLGGESGDQAEVVWTCECEPYPRAVIAERCPGVPCFEDVRTLTTAHGADLPAEIDMLIGGPPCQPTSTAGNRKGEDDDRWLWPEFLRLARELGPSLLFVENPSALLTLDGGRSFGRILGGLSDLGFDAEWTTVRASDVGAPHRRQRIFLLAWQRDLAGLADTRRDAARELAAARSQGGLQPRAHDVADTMCRDSGLDRQHQPEGGRPDAHNMGDADGTRREGAERARGQAQGRRRSPRAGNELRQNEWQREAQSGLGRDFDGLPGRLHSHRFPAPPPQDEGAPAPQYEWEPPRTIGGPQAQAVPHRRPRLKALGNAVVPQQAAHALRILLRRAGLQWLMAGRSAA